MAREVVCYQAEDGKLFGNKEEAESYENNCLALHLIQTFTGIDEYAAKDILDGIKRNKEVFMEILK